MSLLSSVETSIDKYGVDVKLIDGDVEVRTKAFIEPLRYKNTLYIGGEYRSLKGTNKSLYVGKPAFDLKEGKTIVDESGIKYLVERAETYTVNGYKIYDWAILKCLWG